ncbi:hypothetical protein PE066_21110 [Ramlibacter tataouinensis]|uniref:hypothetical protein n=1 Tax=Ramlibacter tataouinensis TaxID=94132 RepID=UPI0022F38BF0|nr:hypothetical protein [Ramlibacter tataouinensis]WBY01912.1 hypothetical protein PE066_21110 [Ramlibacter tataouinensis]
MRWTRRQDTRPTRTRLGSAATEPPPARPDPGDNSASTIIEAPQGPHRNRLDPHDFPDGGGSGGAEAFRRSKVKRD